jgi:hypothetical protein
VTNEGEGSGAFYPEPSWKVRLAGVAGLAGAVLWPVSLGIFAGAAATCTSAVCNVDRGSLGIAALSPILLGLTVLGLELRAPHTLGMGDLVGDITVATAGALFLLAFLAGAVGLVVPGLLLLLIGSTIFGIVGYMNGARQRLASAVVAIGAGSFLMFLFGGALGGSGAGLETPTLLALLLFGIGWGWLGGHLLLARPLPIPSKQGPR